MDQIKIVFFDIDGTLLAMKQKQLSPRTGETLRRLQEKGILICLATGRTPITLPRFEGIQFDAYLTFNGCLCYTESETVFSAPLSAADVKTLLKNAEKLGKPVSVATRDRIEANGVDPELAEYYSFAHLALSASENFEEISRQEVYQVMLGLREHEYMSMLDGVENAKIVAWWDRAVDIVPATGGKGIGVQKILEHFHLSKQEALAFGDGNNDIEMLLAVGTGVAMGNASPQVKAAADAVCGHVAEDGIYHYCKEHNLI